MYTQLNLDLQLKDSYTFDNVVSSDNKLLIDFLKSPNLVEEKQLYSWGAHNTGTTHIMQALCQSLAQQNKSISYLALK